MPEAAQDDDERDAGTAPAAVPARAMSGFGMASALLAVVALAAAMLIGVMWSSHRAAASDRAHQERVLQAASQWTGILININAQNVDTSMVALRDGTVGELNAGFDGAIAPYRDVVKKLSSRTTGQVESVSIEVTHRDQEGQPGQRPPAPASLPEELAARTDTVLVVATSVSENIGTKATPESPDARPTTVRWNLRLGVSEVDGDMRISRLESLR